MYLDDIIFPLFAETVLQVTTSFKWKINLRCIKELIKKKTECNCLSTEVKYVLISQSISKIFSEYDQEIPQSQTADKPMAPRGRSTQQPRHTMKTN